MLKKDIDTLQTYRDSLKTMRFRPTINTREQNDIFNIFWLCLPMLMLVMPNYPQLLFDGSLASDSVLFFWFWTLFFSFSLFAFIARLREHVNGIKSYKSKKESLDHDSVDQLFDKYEVGRKINRNASFTAIEQNMYQLNKLIQSLNDVIKINKINEENT